MKQITKNIAQNLTPFIGAAGLRELLGIELVDYKRMCVDYEELEESLFQTIYEVAIGFRK
jgi:hypothetical protein